MEVSGAQAGALQLGTAQRSADEAGVGETGGGEVGVREVGLLRSAFWKLALRSLASTSFASLSLAPRRLMRLIMALLRSAPQLGVGKLVSSRNRAARSSRPNSERENREWARLVPEKSALLRFMLAHRVPRRMSQLPTERTSCARAELTVERNRAEAMILAWSAGLILCGGAYADGFAATNAPRKHDGMLHGKRKRYAACRLTPLKATGFQGFTPSIALRLANGEWWRLPAASARCVRPGFAWRWCPWQAIKPQLPPSAVVVVIVVAKSRRLAKGGQRPQIHG